MLEYFLEIRKNVNMIRFFSVVAKIIIYCALAVALLFALLFAYVSLFLPSVESLKAVHLEAPLSIFANDGQLIAEFGDIRRIPITYDQIPQPLLEAVLATEDQHFYEHPGVDLLGLARAAAILITTGEKSQGGSTITMQVARNFFLSNKKSFVRKFNEILLALKIDHEFGKEAILELYFNKVFLGEHAYGFGAAAEVYYGKPLNALSLDEYAMLAGLPKAPSSINPIINPEKALERRHHVLSRMLVGQYITQQEFTAADSAPLTGKYHGLVASVQAPYVAETIRSQLYAKYGDAIYNRGINVYTTIDSHLQDAANHALSQGIFNYAQRHGYQGTEKDVSTFGVEGALVSINPNSGMIVAMTGGVDFAKSGFNRVTQARRQIGSSIKPFIYTAALSKGMTLATIENDAPIVINDGSGKIWRPENDDHKFHGLVRMRESLVDSLNLASIRILQQTDIPYAIQFLSKFGFNPKQMPQGLSLALGTPDITPLELANGFSVFANGGYRINAYLINKITDDRQNVIYQKKKIKPCHSNEEVLDQELAQYECAPEAVNPQIIYLLDSAMQDVIGRGTGKNARILGRQDLAGKTGTSDDQRDAWFSGFNQHLVTVVWVGYDTPKSLHEYGSRAALPIWIDYMRVALQGVPEKTLPRPAGIVAVRIDPSTGLQVRANHTPFMFELFRSSTEPPLETVTSPNHEEKDTTQTTATNLSDVY